MPNNKWDEENIENLLKDFPVIKDERPKEDVYRRLKQEGKPQKKSKHWIPYVVAALAFITFGILLASTLGQNSNESAYDTGGSESLEESKDSNSEVFDNNNAGETAEMESSAITEEAEEDSEAFSSMEASDDIIRYSLYEEELENHALLTLGLTENAIVIPVSFLIEDDMLQQDVGKIDADAAEIYNRYAASVDEQALGFDDYHPYSGTVETTANGIEHIIPKDHIYDMASASMTVYFNSLAATFPDAEEISIVEENGSPATFDQVGTVQPIEPVARNLAYYAYEASSGETYLVPGYDMPHDTAIEALNAMKSSPNDLYLSLIPEGLEYSISETEETVVVEFDEAVDFNSYAIDDAVRMIEGMVLAADSFGKELMMMNITTDDWNDFDFSKALPVPMAINIREFQ